MTQMKKQNRFWCWGLNSRLIHSFYFSLQSIKLEICLLKVFNIKRLNVIEIFFTSWISNNANNSCKFLKGEIYKNFHLVYKKKKQYLPSARHNILFSFAFIPHFLFSSFSLSVSLFLPLFLLFSSIHLSLLNSLFIDNHLA